MQEVIDTEFTLYTPEGKTNIMKLVFSDGKLIVDESFDTIRNRLWSN